MTQNKEEKIYNESISEFFIFQIKTCEILESIMAEHKVQIPLDVSNFIDYTLEKITNTIKIHFKNILKYSDKYYLISEVSSSARMVFESISSLLFILKSDNFNAYYDYCYKTKELDEQAVKNIKEFLDSNQVDKNNKKPEIILKKLEADISRIANYLEYLNETLNLKKHNKFPKVGQRCKELGGYWEFEYISSYYMISNNLHGNVKNMHHGIIKKTNSEHNLKEKYNVNLHLTWISSTLGQFLEEISELFSSRKHIQQFDELKLAHQIKLDQLFNNSRLNIVRA